MAVKCRYSPLSPTFGTAVEVTTSELSIELAFPANVASAEALKALTRNLNAR